MSGKGVELKVNVPGKGSDQSPPSSQLGTRLPVQDYDKLRRKSLANNTLYEDPYFPAEDSSLFYSQKLPFKPKWLRPKDIVSQPKLFTGGASRFDVSQGILGNCWLVAAIASLTQDKILMKNVIPQDQDFDRGYAGIFHFKFWHFGEWVDVVIDDRLPTHNGKLIFIHSTEEDEFWSALMEKAYAKLYGGYEALKGGNTSEAMVDFTGGVVENFELAKQDDIDALFKGILKGAKRSSLMSCSIAVVTKEDIEAKLNSGLVKGHAYSVTGACTVPVKGKEVRLVRIRNPWGQKEWNGDWSDNSSTWKIIPESKRKECQGDQKDDGEFWMSIEDMKKHFTHFEVCSVSVDELVEDDSVKNWNTIIINGSWDKDKGNAGGCRNFPTFTNNPQFVIQLDEDDDGDGKCSAIIALMQKHRRKQKKMGVQDLCIGFSVYKAPSDGSMLTKKHVDYHHSDGSSGSFTNAREVHTRLDLDPGKYIIVPTAFKPNEEGEFLLRVFTEKSSKKSTTTGEANAGSAVGDKIKEMFTRLAGADGEIDSEELQDMLTAHFSKNMSGSTFSLDACRSMIAMLDWDKNGTLNLAEFESLLGTIGMWKKMFFKFDRDRSGSLERNEAHQAVRSLGYPLSPEAFNILFNRFAKRRKYMNMDDFAACLARVKIMNDIFEKKNDFKSSGSIQLSQDEFFKITLDA